MWVLLAAAALVAPKHDSDLLKDPDMHCLGAFSVALGMTMSQDANDESKKMTQQLIALSLISNVTYYIGRLDERYPGLDYAETLAKLYLSPDYAKQVDSDMARCSVEAKAHGAAIQAWGKKLQQIMPVTTGHAG